MRFSKFLTLLGVGSAISAGAQTFVPTTVQKKAIVLEEYTGIYCGFCPDGHKRAATLKAANPSAVIIAVHSGSFADPDPGDVDLRSDISSYLASKATGLKGYPAGAVNRTNFYSINTQYSQDTTNGGIAQSRGTWAATGDLIKAENAPVNVAAQASIDLSTRELEVIVETYYTANATNTTNKLNVFILQDNIEGVQSGSSANPTSVLPNGNYNHTHVLRHALTPNAGQTINTTTTGHFQADTFRYTLPSSYPLPTGSVGTAPGVRLNDIKIAVSVAEDEYTILNGGSATPTLITPPGKSVAEGSLEAKGTIASASYCNVDYTPSFTFKNEGTSAIDTVRIMAYTGAYNASATPLLDTLITTTVAAGASATVNWATKQWADKDVTYVFDFTSYNANSLIDLSAVNYVTQTSAAKFAQTNGSYTVLDSLKEDFSGVANYTPNTSTSIFDNHTDVDPALSSALTGFGLSSSAYRFRFQAMSSGDSTSLVFMPVDFTNLNNAELTFSHAYARTLYQGTTYGQDGLKVFVSSDCGATWTTVFNKSGANLETVSPISTTGAIPNFYAAAGDWDTTTVDLSAFAGQAEVVIAFRGLDNGSGTNLYIDDINTKERTISNATAVETFNTSVAVYPNPVANEMAIELTNAVTSEASVSVFNAVGQAVISLGSVNLEEGIQTLNVNTSDLVNGVYFVNIVSDNGNTTKRFVVSK